MRFLPTTLGLLLALGATASARVAPEVRATYDALSGRVVIETRVGPTRHWGVQSASGGVRIRRDWAASDCYGYGSNRTTYGSTGCAPQRTSTGRTARPRGPAAWNDCAPVRQQPCATPVRQQPCATPVRQQPCATPVRADPWARPTRAAQPWSRPTGRLQPCPAPRQACAPAACPTAEPCDVRLALDCEDDAATWRANAEPARRAIPRAWRDQLSSTGWLELHGKLRAAVEGPRAQLQLMDELARTSTLNVEQAIGLVATIRASRDRLVALTLLHPAITDRAAFGRAYSLLSTEDAELLHFRVTRVTDGCVDQNDPRFLRLQAQERELIELLGDVGE